MLYINTALNKEKHCAFYFGLEEYLIKDFNYDNDIFMLWNVEPTVMIGRHQITNLEINKDYVDENNIHIVRRNSGGGAVFTDLGCLQFSFITDKKEHSKNIFEKHVKHIVDAVKDLGIDATFTGRNDILSNGLKFSGNAEYIYKDKMVMHGTILFETDFENLLKSLNPDKIKLTSKAITSVKSRVTNIGEKTNLTLPEFYDYLVNKIKTSEVDYQELDLHKVDAYKQKFYLDEWNYGKNPKFAFTKKKRFKAGTFRVDIDLKNNVVINLKLSGDYFAFKDIKAFEDSFVGINFTYDDFFKVLKQNRIKEYIYLMKTSNFLELVFDQVKKKISKPDYLKVNLKDLNKQTAKIKALLSQHNLHTVCQEAACPNQLECFSNKTATFMILGTKCTRNCKFCDVTHGEPDLIDKSEPSNILKAVEVMGLKHVVITSVTRDDLKDYGANQFKESILLLKDKYPETTVEVLIPDLMGDIEALKVIVDAKPDVINHNLETVEELYEGFRDNADYQRSLNVLKNVKQMDPSILTKSGIMVGIGEKEESVYKLMDDLRNIDCDILTIGQYLRPSLKHVEVKEYVTEEMFEKYKTEGKRRGFRYVASGPLVRSSYQALKQFEGE